LALAGHRRLCHYRVPEIEAGAHVPLKSRLFRGDPKLEAAAVSNAAHITQGATGQHVLKIQLAVARLDGVPITQDSMYGLKTAAAVLAYKQKRSIINRSYQTKADDIVGIMTMAALDQEMFQLEQGPSAVRVIRCDLAQGAPGNIAS
jgi:peptidoglycan hydrolase-like protein with peptidoglycan-binding domain